MGEKKLETRSWQTAYRGPLLIHASLGTAGALLTAELPFKKYIPDFSALPFGCIIGKVQLVSIVRIGATDFTEQQLNRLSLEERAFGDYATGRFVWLLEEAIAFAQPVPVRGALQLWEYQGPLP